MATYDNTRTGIFSSIDIFTEKRAVYESLWKSVRSLTTSGKDIKISSRWLRVRLPEPIKSTRSAFTPDTRPKTFRYCLTSSISLGQRYIFTPISAYESINTIETDISKEYISRRDGYYELKNLSKRYIVLALTQYSSRQIYILTENYDNLNTVDAILSKSKSSNRFIFADSDYISKRYTLTPTYDKTTRKVFTLLNIYISLNDVDFGIGQRFNSSRNVATISDDGLFRFAIYEATDGHQRYSKRLVYWQPKPRHFSVRKIIFNLPLYSNLNTVLLYEGTKFWQDRYVITDWFIYNSVRYVHQRYKVNDLPLTIGSTDVDRLYTEEESPRCFSFKATSWKVKDVNLYDMNKNLKDYEKCSSESKSQISKFGIYIPHNENLKARRAFHLEIFDNKGKKPGDIYQVKRYQIRTTIKSIESNDRYITVKI